MPPKSRKSSSLWLKCDKCGAVLYQRDLESHSEKCPPVGGDGQFFILNGRLNGSLEIRNDENIKGLSSHEVDNLIFLSQSALQLGSFVIGDPVVVETILDNNIKPCVKTIWPTAEKSLTTVQVTQTAFDLVWKPLANPNIKIYKPKTPLRTALEIIVVSLNMPKSLPKSKELQLRIKRLHLNRVFTVKNKISLIFFGKRLDFRIEKITANPEDSLSESIDQLKLVEEANFYQCSESTKWTVYENKDALKKSRSEVFGTSAVGGLDAQIKEVKDALNLALHKSASVWKVSRGILVHGAVGTGKTMLIKAISRETGANVVDFSKSDEDPSTIFDGMLDASPSILLVDDLDLICPAKSSKAEEKKNAQSLRSLLDKMRETEGCRMAVLAATSKPEAVDPLVRRFACIDFEVELPTPNPLARLEILRRLLPQMKTEQLLADVSARTHGFVGADLARLCQRAYSNTLLRSSHTLDFEDFQFALTRVGPSAMREVQVEVPDVRWDDIGGQQKLKLALRQAVEWPLKRPDSFKRMGISPPRGLLMFGPPGCSKTMIARALATESGLNFISIKGPELLSKWVGESERAVREVFRRARQVAPAIVFFDELDALGGERSAGSGPSGGGGVQERVLAQLLSELDGVTPLENVMVLAATNRPDRIDRALLRPGRLDRLIYVPLPDLETRQEILSLRLQKMPTQGLDLERLAGLTEGFSGAELDALCREAALAALEKDLDAETVLLQDFERALMAITPRTPAYLLKIYDEYASEHMK